MAGNLEYTGVRRGSRWRIAPWAIAALLWLLPLIAIQFTDEVAWDETDFIVFGAMLAGACGAWELAARMTGNTAYRAAVGVAVAAAFILVWMNLAVGIIGPRITPPTSCMAECSPSRSSARSLRAFSHMEWHAR